MGFFDSKSSSSNTTSTQNQSSGAQDEAISIVSDGNVTITDNDAIQNMFSITMAALDGQQQSAENALGLNEKSLSFAAGVKNPESDNIKKLGLYFAVATVVVVVAAVVFPNIKG